jgi:dishevelled associated activator of morphogenesis
MSLINALVNYGAGEDYLEFRLHLRFEFIMLGIDKIIEKLRKYENETLDRHLDFFDLVRSEDEKELSRKFSNESIDAESAIEMFDLLKRKLNYSAAFPHFLSLLQHMLLLPFTNANTHYWLLFDRIVQQIVLQQQNEARPSSEIENFFEKHMPSENSIKPKISNPDVAPLEIDVNKIVKLLVREEELIEARKKAEELERENLEFVAKLSKKEQELDLRIAEKEDLETNLIRMRERLEKESTHHSQAVTRAINAEMKIEDLQHKFMNEQQERLRLEKLMAEGSFPDDQKAAGLQGNKDTSSRETSVKAPPAPPPIPMNCVPPPPPGNLILLLITFYPY